jgi:MoaA/NifB/PqqE/SkfB family radical SAM enzyme
MQKQTVAFSKDSSNLFFHILTLCNLSCAHCYINPEEHGKQTLDIGTIQNWLTLFKEKASQTNLVILGGEPTLHPDLDRMVKTARAMGFKSITIDSNGYLFHNILDKISPDDVDFLSFSLDGATRQTNDRIRGKGCYDTVLKNLEQAVSRQFSCSMIYTVSDMNIHELALMPALVRKLGIKHFFIQVIGMRGEALHPHAKSKDAFAPVNKTVWLEMIPKVAEMIAGHGILVTYPKVFLDMDEPFECAGNVADNYFVFPNGRVYHCPICEDFALHSYEIRNNTLVPTPKINELDLFKLNISEGCVMNKMIQPENLAYDEKNHPLYRIACCMLKEQICMEKSI